MRGILAFIVLMLGLVPFARADTEAPAFEIYLDADFSVSFAAAEAIELGVRTALDEVGYRIGGRPVALVRRDHRGNLKLSLRTMEEYVASDTALAVIGGLHSPPYITNQAFMNDNRILTLLPWSAGAPITRPTTGHENWIFRLSVDDSKAGEFFIREAVDRGGCQAVALVLLDTAWGRSGEGAMTAALQVRGMLPASVEYFPFTVGNAGAGTLATAVSRAGADCAIMMSNAANGATVMAALHQHAPQLRVFSHWGIMGGTFADLVPHGMRQAHDLKVLQTCGLEVEAAGSAVLNAAIARAKPGANRLTEIGAITGFVHGYDLTRILIAAAGQAATTDAWSGPITAQRLALKTALEALDQPVDGILKQYVRPFGPWTPASPDAHEALGLQDLCMASFSQEGLLIRAN